jgi:hypothetical protein
MLLENWISTHTREKLNSCFTTHAKANLKWIKALHVNTETIKLHEEIKEEKLLDTDFGNDHFWIGHQKCRQQNKNEQVRLCQTTKLLHSKATINKIKRQPMKLEKISSRHGSDRG